MTPGREEILAALGETLTARTDELRDPESVEQVDVVAICADLRLALRVEEGRGGRQRGAYRAAAETPGARPEIVVYRNDGEPRALDPGERFTIAHEIGHHVIADVNSFVPLREGEYWRCEEICNAFAAALLVPPAMRRALNEPATATELADAITSVARRYAVSAQVAARVVIAAIATPSAAGTLRFDRLAHRRRLGFREWWTENAGFAGEANKRRAIYEGEPLASAFEEMWKIPQRGSASPGIEGTRMTYLRRRSPRVASFAALLAGD